MRTALAIILALAQPSGALTAPAVRSPCRAIARRSIPTMAFAASFDGRADSEGKWLRDALMSRSVETQVANLGGLNERGLQVWLHGKWSNFAERNAGRLTDFLDELVSAEPESIFVPTQSFRQGSSNNPYLKEQKEAGFHFEVQPTKVAKKLALVRGELASAWVAELERMSSSAVEKLLALEATEGCEDAHEDATALTMQDHQAAASSAAAYGQLLRSMATRVAVQEMLHDLALLPSQKHLHDWLSTFVLVTHAPDLTREGSVDAMLRDLGAQPLHIRGGTLVDPMQIEKDLVRRTSEITTDMADLLRDTLEDESLHNNFLWRTTSVGSDDLHANLLERCFNL